MIGFGFTSHWLRKWREFYQPITERSNAKPKEKRNYFRHAIENRSIYVYVLVEDVDSKLEEGDIVHEESSDDSGELDKRNALRSRKKLWRTKIVPYEVTAELSEFQMFQCCYRAELA